METVQKGVRIKDKEAMIDPDGIAIHLRLTGVEQKQEDLQETHTDLQKVQGQQVHTRATDPGDQAVLHQVPGVGAHIQGQEVILLQGAVAVVQVVQASVDRVRQDLVLVQDLVREAVQAEVQAGVQ